MTPPWLDWSISANFCVRVAPPAAEKLIQLPPDLQLRLRQMVQDIAELAAMAPPGKSRTWREGDSRQLLQLRLGRINVRYSLNEEARTLTVEHLVVPQGGDLGQTG